MALDSHVRLVADVHAVLGEGPVWVAREAALYWLDVKGYKIFRLRGGELSHWPTPFRVGAIVPRQSGGFVAGTDQGIARIEPEANRFEILFNPEDDIPGNRFNDGKVDRQGRFWPGTMDDSEKEATGTLYRIDSDLGCHAFEHGFKVPNGPAFSPSGETMYVNDSPLQVTYKYECRADGANAGRQPLLKFANGDGYPDGMTVDCEGCLWIAFWDGWCVRRFSPEGELLQTVEMPVAKPTSCAFGGPDLETLYVTSASIGISEDDLQMQPNAGGLFMLTPGVRGLEEVPFAGRPMSDGG